MTSAVPTIPVAAGILRDARGRVLIARRPDDAHAGGHWEFPGGKIAAGETPEQGLVRELGEELGVRVLKARPLVRCSHRYPDREVLLHAFVVEDYEGEPRGLESQPLRWVVSAELQEAGILPADLPIVAALLREEGSSGAENAGFVSRESGGT